MSKLGFENVIYARLNPDHKMVSKVDQSSKKSPRRSSPSISFRSSDPLLLSWTRKDEQRSLEERVTPRTLGVKSFRSSWVVTVKTGHCRRQRQKCCERLGSDSMKGSLCNRGRIFVGHRKLWPQSQGTPRRRVTEFKRL